MKYHINPETGNANLCRARTKCRFGSEADHYSSKEEAAQAFEEQVRASKINVLQGRRLAKGAKILFALDRAQQEVIAFDEEQKRQGLRVSDDKRFFELIDKRNYLKRQLQNLPWADDAPVFDDSFEIDFILKTFSQDEDRFGYDNDAFNPGEEETKVYEQLDLASAEWMARLSTAEIKALSLYNADSVQYAKAMRGEENELDPRAIQYLHSAMEKAPRSRTPFTVYAGISPHRAQEVLKQCKEGLLVLNRIQSASANPAQVNGFMFQSDAKLNDWAGSQDETAVEFTVNRVASLSAFNIHKGEMEILVPPGLYEVTQQYQNVNYYWGGVDRTGKTAEERKSGRTSNYTFLVRPQAV